MNDVIIYGAKGIQTQRTRDYLISKGKNIVAFADSNPELSGKYFDGIKCLCPDELQFGDSVVVIAASGRSSTEICRDLTKRGVDWVTIGQLALNYENEEFQKVYSILDDELSVNTFRAATAARYMLQPELLSLVAEPKEKQYFGFWNAGDYGVYVDVGACMGDTVERYFFANLCAKKIYAFEPVPHYFSALQSRCKRLSEEWAVNYSDFILSNFGLGFENNIGTYENTNSLPAFDKVVALDSFLCGKSVDFIKADIEGMEMDMLRGASQTIQKHKPKLAICIYHTVWDFYEIPLYLKSLVPQYKMAIRHYSSTMSETVLYCWIQS